MIADAAARAAARESNRQIAQTAIGSDLMCVWFVRAAGSKFKSKLEFRKRFQGESKQHAVFLDAAVVANDPRRTTRPSSSGRDKPT